MSRGPTQVLVSILIEILVGKATHESELLTGTNRHKYEFRFSGDEYSWQVLVVLLVLQYFLDKICMYSAFTTFYSLIYKGGGPDDMGESLF